MIKSRRFRWAGHVARIWERRGETGITWGNLREGDNLEDRGLDLSIILKCILVKCGGAHRLDRSVQDRNTCRAVVNAAMNTRVS